MILEDGMASYCSRSSLQRPSLAITVAKVAEPSLLLE
jgi:hypothetical protein